MPHRLEADVWVDGEPPSTHRYRVHKAGQVISDARAELLGLTAKTSDVPDGTTDEVLDWVDGDPDRARQALEVEGSDGRKGLTAQLRQIAEADST